MNNFPVMEAVLALTITGALLILLYIQIKKDTLDLRCLILDDCTNKPSIHKIGQALCLLISTWGFVYQIEHNTFTSEYLTIYMTVWAGVGAINKLLDKKSDTGEPK